MNLMLLVPGIAGILVWTTGCGAPQPDFEHLFERSVESAVRTNGATIQLSSMTSFPWDRVFIFHPYMTPEAINKQLGFEWRSPVKGELEYSDAFELLVFLRDGQVVETAKVRRKIGDWVLGQHNGFRPGEDVFLVNRAAGNPETVFRLRGTN